MAIGQIGVTGLRVQRPADQATGSDLDPVLIHLHSMVEMAVMAKTTKLNFALVHLVSIVHGTIDCRASSFDVVRIYDISHSLSITSIKVLLLLADLID